MSRRRAAVAALLGLLAPGLGHAYLRAWIRAVAWFALAVATVAVLLPPEASRAVESGGLDAAIEASASLPTQVYLASAAVRLTSALDAALLGFRGGTAGASGSTEGPSCPHCGGELDEELDFCPWCTTRLETRQ